MRYRDVTDKNVWEGVPAVLLAAVTGLVVGSAVQRGAIDTAWGGSAVVADHSSEQTEGTVVSAGNALIVLEEDDEEQTFTVLTDAQITLDGETASLDDLKKGHTAVVTHEKQGDQVVAKKIEARKKS